MADKICGTFTVLKFGNAVVLGAKGDEIAHRRLVASFHVAPQELSTLRKAERIYRWSGAEYVVRGQLPADEVDLLGDVAEEGRGAVRGAILRQFDDMDIGPAGPRPG